MTQTDPHKIVILETNQSRRDYLRAIVSGRGCVPIIFEKETICLDNLRPLEPDLVISGPLSHDRMYRFVNTVKMMDGSLPVLILSGDRSIMVFVISLIIAGVVFFLCFIKFKFNSFKENIGRFFINYNI